MPKYLLSVYGPAERTEFGAYPSKEAMLQAFADTGAFNDRLVAEGYFVFADGLEQATTATVVDGQGAVTFLVKIKEAIEDPQRLLLDL